MPRLIPSDLAAQRADSAGTSAETGGDHASVAKQLALVAGAMIGLGAGFSVLYFGTFGVFLKPIVGEFGWTRGQASYVMSIALLGNTLATPFFGFLIDRVGPVRPILFGVLSLASSLYILSTLDSDWTSYAGWNFLLGAAAVGTGTSAYLTALQHAFNRRLGLALGLAMTGLGLGTMIAPSIAQFLLADAGWRSAYRTLALIALCAGSLSTLLVGLGQPARGARRGVEQDGREGFTPAEAFRDWRLWVLSLAIFLGTLAGLGAAVHLVPLLTDRGLSPATSAQIFGVVGMGLVLGRLGSGFLMDILFAPMIAIAGFALGIAGLGIFATQVSDQSLTLMLASLMVGLAMGVEGDFAAYAVRRYFGNRSFGSIYGIVYAFFSFGGVAGPALFGFMFDLFGGYGAVLGTAMAAFLAAALLLLTLGPYRFGSAQEHGVAAGENRV